MSELPVHISLALTALAALLGVLVSTPLVLRFAHRRGVVDDPGGRRIHEAVTPRLGGIGIAIGGLAGVAAASWIPGIARPGHGPLTIVFFATLGIIMLGVIDDLRHVKAQYKLIIQIVLAVICWLGGARVESLGISILGIGKLTPLVSCLITVAWVVGVTNAINLLDGLDGLAAGVVAIVTATLMMAGYMNGSGAAFLLYTSAALCAACVGFLIFNSHPARIFMGDTGSLFLGFLLANISILSFQKSTAAAGLAIPILALGIPIADTVLAFGRRILKGRSPFVADRHHLHHVLHYLGIGRRFAVIVIYAGTGLLCASALLSLVYGSWALGVGVGILAIGLIWTYALHSRSLKIQEIEAALESSAVANSKISGSKPVPDDLLNIAGAND